MKELNLSQVRYIVIHCSASREDRPYTVERLLKDHIARGFSGIGYHYFVTRSGHIHLTRPLDKIGAHVQGYNHCSIGVCYEGGINKDGLPADTRTVEQKATLVRLIRMLKLYCPLASVVGHRDLSKDVNGDGIISPHEWVKQCPCFDASIAYARV
ncbi:MAG: N-acetylmuramoyl-L-alanine amidase [Porphyromonas sp.]|nr:N-acetylmuramoyl-L-alanine amidase [Porphyromonas sp.]